MRWLSASPTDVALCTPPAWARGEVVLPEVRFPHLFVPRGTVTLEGAGELAEGDPVRFTVHGYRLPATGGQRATGVTDAEIQVWEMHAAQSV
jgi:hypothetical protein